MMLPKVSSFIFLCAFCIDVATCVSLQSFLSKSVAVSLPEDQRVTTVDNIKSGKGVVRPTKPSPPTAAPVLRGGANQSGSKDWFSNLKNGSQNQASWSKIKPINTLPVTRQWRIEAMFEMTTTAAILTNEFDASVEGFALTIANNLKWTTGAPLSRFSFWLPDRMQMANDKFFFCESKNTEGHTSGFVARYATSENTTYKCEKQSHQMNATVGSSLLQTKAPETLTFEVGVFPPSGLAGDDKPSAQLVEDIVSFSTSDDEPKRKLLPTGLWSYMPGLGVKFHGLFPSTMAAMPGSGFKAPRDTSLPLGPNPGGQGAARPPLPPPPTPKENQKADDTYFNSVEATVKESNEINTSVKNSLQELKDSLARASAMHSAVMNTKVYQLPEGLID